MKKNKVNEKVEFAKTRTPEQFISYIDQFLKDLDVDIKQLGNIANTYSNSVSANKSDKDTAKNYSTLLKGLNSYVDRARTAPQNIKGFVSQGQPKTNAQQAPAMKSTSVWDKAKSFLGK
jgi:hypothetical protein